VPRLSESIQRLYKQNNPKTDGPELPAGEVALCYDCQGSTHGKGPQGVRATDDCEDRCIFDGKQAELDTILYHR
jgi:hypothetical protein